MNEGRIALPVDTYSPDQLSELILEIDTVAGALRDNAVRSQGKAVEPSLSADLDQMLQENNITIDDTQALDTLNQQLKNLLEKAPSVHILLAAMPSRAMKRQFVTWFRTEIHPLLLVTFAARSDLGGGAIIQAGSHLYDFSFRRRLLDNKARLTEIAGV